MQLVPATASRCRHWRLGRGRTRSPFTANLGLSVRVGYHRAFLLREELLEAAAGANWVVPYRKAPQYRAAGMLTRRRRVRSVSRPSGRTVKLTPGLTPALSQVLKKKTTRNARVGNRVLDIGQGSR